MNNLAAVARGDIPAELVIKNARIANVFTGSYQHNDVAICAGTVAGIGSYDGINEYDAGGRVLIPALIDGHIHIEDTMMNPVNFAKEAAKHGTGTVFADPHEIASVLGTEGIELMVKLSKNLPVDILYGVPSCVPARALSGVLGVSGALLAVYSEDLYSTFPLPFLLVTTSPLFTKIPK